LNTNNHDESARVSRILEQHRGRPGALLPILHAVQDSLGYIPEWSIPQIASELNQSRAEVHGVVSFYHHFYTTPRERHTVHVCQAEACQARGARELTEHAEKKLGCKMNGHCHDKGVGLEPVYCLGLCAVGPAMMVDDQLHAQVDAEAFDRIVSSTLDAS
jgi:formate dehydrogenase subunit gamma